MKHVGRTIAVASAALLGGVALVVSATPGPGDPVPGTYICWSARMSELLAEDARQANSASGPTVLPERIMQRVMSGGSPHKYLVRANGTFADVTWGAKYASDPKYNGRYATRGGLVRLDVRGTPLYTFRRARSTDGTELLVQVREEKRVDPYASTQVCRLTTAGGGNARPARPAPRDEPREAPPAEDRPAEDGPDVTAAPAANGLVRGHPNWAFAYPANVMVSFEDYAETPVDAIVELTFEPSEGGEQVTFRRTVTALRTSAALDDSRSLEETGYLPILSPGAFRVRAMLIQPDGARRPLEMRHPDGRQSTEAELEWGDHERYQEGGGKILYVIADPAR